MSSQNNNNKERAFVLKYSHNIIEHLGLKLYQNKPTNVIAELISNSWDADAENVWIELNKPNSVAVMDNGVGMTREELVEKYLVIGKKKRTGETLASRTTKERCIMGRKGIGKLAPFGIARKLSLITVSETTGLFYWIELDLSGMLSDSENLVDPEPQIYEPNIICDGVKKSDLPLNRDSDGYVNRFLERIDDKGTLIILSNLSLKKSISENRLKESIGQRFTVTLLSSDFSVSVNEEVVTEKDALPTFYRRYPDKGYNTETVKINGKDREVKYWVGFVEKADWPQDQAGIGVYTHGKIAQDRPFVFGVKGSEIWTRYMYGVVEADWLDEFEEDVVSTDRTSINWEHDDTKDLYNWGQDELGKWIRQYQKDRKEDNKGNVTKKVQSLQGELEVTRVEQEAIADIVCSMSNKVHKDEQLQTEVINKLTSAWTHQPSQAIIKSLWSRVDSTENENEFITVLDKIHEQLVPEAMSLSVMVSQRIYALTKLERLSKTGTEPQLQALLEDFPWILGSDKGKVYADQTMKEIAKIAAIDGTLEAHGATASELKDQPDSGTRPDFTVFADSNKKTIILTELKSPLRDLERIHYNQLQTYMGWFEDHYSDANVFGYLIGRNPNDWRDKNHHKNIEIMSWEDVCRHSRRDYVELLASMINGVSAEYIGDYRIRKAIELGGQESIDLLKKLAEANSTLSEFFERNNSRTGGNFGV
ncbi:ATP-binding protein [Idiomarina abyssalis]|uniref:ATP-binding protein n=1 Tax=Idiomarina abyssalis TaxID=86102 RepID=UPI003A90BBAA